MTNLTLQERVVENKDWATAVFLLCLILVTITRSAFENRFAEFSRLAISDKYLKIYRDGTLADWFTIALFVVQVASFAFFIQLLLNYFGHADKSDWVLFIRLFTLLGVFILSKYLVEKIIATAFNIEEFANSFNMQKVSYRTYTGLLLLPINIVLFYHNKIAIELMYGLIVVVLLINAVTYLNSLKIYQNLIVGKLFYFILYLCALEIAPYCFMYYWFTRS